MQTHGGSRERRRCQSSKEARLSFVMRANRGGIGRRGRLGKSPHRTSERARSSLPSTVPPLSTRGGSPGHSRIDDTTTPPGSVAHSNGSAGAESGLRHLPPPYDLQAGGFRTRFNVLETLGPKFRPRKLSPGPVASRGNEKQRPGNARHRFPFADVGDSHETVAGWVAAASLVSQRLGLLCHDM